VFAESRRDDDDEDDDEDGSALSACCDWEFEDVDAEDRRLL
jgi:hypothetical protein